MRRTGIQPLLAGALLAALVVVWCAEPMPAAGKTGEQPASGIVTTLAATVASKLRQLDALKRDIEESGCEFAADDASIEGCGQLEAKLRMLEAEIDELKSRAGWTLEKQKAVEAGGPLAPPPAPRPYTYRWQTDPAAAYRTVCVRLCDGFYYPIGEVSRPANFLAEEKTCRSTCSVPAQLFYQPRPAGGDVGEMVSLTGERYADLPNAFRYRSEYVAACACGPKPWSAEAKAQYHRRAVLAARTRLERMVAAGAGATAKVLAEADLEIAQRTPRARDVARVKLGQYPYRRGLFGWRYRVQARNEPAQRRFFLFRSR